MPVYQPSYKVVDGSASTGGGDVTGAASSTDNAIALWDGSSGTDLKNSVVIVNAGAVSGVTTLVASSSVTASALIPSSATVPSNGIYLPAANTVGVSSNTTAVAYFLSSSGPNLQFRNLTTETSFIYQSVNDGLMNLSGGTGSAVGGNLRVFGGAHATQASDTEIRAGATTVYQYDHSAVSHLFAGDLIDLNTTGSSSVQIQKSGSNILHILNNGTETGSAALILAVDNTVGTDPYVRFTLTGNDSWSFGVDNSDSDALVYSNNSTLGTNNRFRVAGNSFQLNLGSAASPSYSFIGDVDSGAYSPGANIYGIAVNGLAHYQVSNSSGSLIFQFDTTSGNGSFVRNAVSNGLMSISSDTASSSGSNIRMFGSTHATQASDFELRQGSTNVYQYDHSAASHLFSGVGGVYISTQADPGAVTDAIRIGSQDVSAGNATLSLRTETAVVAEAVTSDETLSVYINGVLKRILLKA